MSYMVAEPQIMASVSAEIERIGSAISAANAAAAGPTTALVAAATDEVSQAITNVFGAFGKEYQAVLAQLGSFNAEFAETLAAAGTAYAQAEVAGVAALQGSLGLSNMSAGMPSAAVIPPFPANIISLFVGPTGVPQPSLIPGYISQMNSLYVRSPYPPSNLVSLFTPEELYPLTGIRSMVLDQSVQEGTQILQTAILNQIAAGNTVTVSGYSQSSIIASKVMQNFAAMGAGAPLATQLNFVLVGNEMNPNGGMLSRFPLMPTIPSLGLTFYGSTPSNTIYPTAIYTLEYDGFADFPRYPLNIISNINAIMGIPFVHSQYAKLTVDQVNNAVQLPTSPGYSGVTNYYMIRTPNLPLLEPLRAIPVIGNPLANLIQPDLKVIVNLGYGDPAYGYSTTPADLPTPFGLFPEVSPITVAEALAAGTQQGIQDFTTDISRMLTQPVTAPSLSFELPPAPNLSAVTPAKIVNAVSSIVSTDYAVLLPTADIGLALVTTMPLYNGQLFFDQLSQGNLINAIGFPLAADMGLLTIGAGIEALTVIAALEKNVKDIEGIFA